MKFIVHGKRRRRQRGQIIVAAPILILLMVGAFLVAMNVATMVRERINIQVAADAAARDGAYVQAQALGSIAIMNAGIVAANAEIGAGVAEIASIWPWDVAEGIVMVIEGRRAGNALRDAQQAIMDAVPALVEAVVILEARSNGATFASVTPGVSTLSLQLKDSFSVWPFISIRIRDDAPIGEKVVVSAYKSGGSVIPGNQLLRGKNGPDLTYPHIVAFSAARPYFWRFGQDPRDPNLSFILRTSSMLIAGLGWEAKLTTIQ